MSLFSTQKSNLPCVENNDIFANELNEFYSRFDTHDFTNECNELLRELKDKNDPTREITLSDVNSALSKKDTSKAPAPSMLVEKFLKNAGCNFLVSLEIYFNSQQIHNKYLFPGLPLNLCLYLRYLSLVRKTISSLLPLHHS